MYVIVPTTAENIIGAVDACGQFPNGADVEFASLFLDIPTDQAQNALIMAQQLKLVTLIQGKYRPDGPFSVYLVTSNEKQRAVIFRMALEQFVPFQTFKNRLKITGLAPKAAEQTKIIHNLTTHREDIATTCISIGQYSGSLVFEGAGLYRASNDPLTLVGIEPIINDLESAKQYVYEKLGAEATSVVDPIDVLEQLTIAILQIGHDNKAPIVHTGNAVESFLYRLAQTHNIDITGANGINSKADRLKNSNKLTLKLYNMSKYLGHLRNAADHGTDPDIGTIWDFTKSSSSEYVHVGISFIRAVIAFEASIYRI